MKKHIIGLALFSFIITTAAVIYGFLNFPKIIPVPAPQYGSASEPTSCWKMKRHSKELVNSPIVTQAIFNMKTKKLSWKLVSVDSDYPTVLHFFIKDEKGLHNFDSIYAESAEKDEELNFSVSYVNTTKLSPQATLYLIADTDSAYIFSDALKRPVEFDIDKAIPVTIDYGK